MIPDLPNPYCLFEDINVLMCFFLISLKSLTLDPDPFGPFNRNSYLSQCSSQRAIEPPGFGTITHDVEFESLQQHHHNVKCQNYLRDNLNFVLYFICVYV